MEISYKDGTPEEIITAIQEKLGGRKLGKMVQFNLDGNDLDVTIKKMGTSHLSFKNIESNKCLTWQLTKEKIALSHKAFKGEVWDKISKIIEQTGGNVVD